MRILNLRQYREATLFVSALAVVWASVDAGALRAQTSGGATIYPYPEYVQSAPMAGPVWQTTPPPGTIVVPTLGITPMSAFRPGGPGYRPEYGYQRAYRIPVSAYQNPGLVVEMPPADTAPAITYPQPSYPGNDPSVFVNPLPPLGSSWPSSPPPHQPRPLVRLQNLPPGTYPGQGIVGQPKAYVDGQPVRNLMRYFSPW